MKNLLVAAAMIASFNGCKNKANDSDAQDQSTEQPADDQSNIPAPQLPPPVAVSGQDDSKSFSIDSRVAADAIMAQMDEAVNATSSTEESAPAADSGLHLVGPIKDRTRTCTADAATKSATEVAKLSLLIDKKFSLFGRSTVIKVSATEDRTSKWTKEVDGITCAGPRVKRPANLKGTVMDSTFSRSFERSIASKVLAGDKNPFGGILGGLLGDLFQESGSSEAKGSRKITWLADDTANKVRTEKHQVETSVTKKTTKKTGKDEISYETSLKTKDGDPVTVEVSRSAGIGLLGLGPIPHSKIIQSGTLIATRKDGSRIESHFDKVKYEFKKSGCSPVSGKLSGEIYAAVAVAPTPAATPIASKEGEPTPVPTAVPADPKKFTIDFAVQPPVIEFSDGKKEPFLPMGCDFEDLGSSVK